MAAGLGLGTPRLALAGLGLVLASCQWPASQAKPTAQPLNLVLILADALRAASLPLYGYPRQNAPHLAELARESLVFEHHLVHFPGTPVSVSQLVTGRLLPPLLMGYSHSLAPVRAPRADLLILPKALREAGYANGLVSSHPWFDESARLLEHFETRALVEPEAGHPYASFERLAPAVSEFLEQRARDARPFFLYVHAMDTHLPFRRHRGFAGFRRERGTLARYNAYDAAILYTDHWVQRVVEELRARALLERTLLVFTSDHGEEFGELGSEWWNKSHGSTLRPAQLHVPLLLRLPEAARAGSRQRATTGHVDLAPTLLRLALPAASLSGYRLDGRDLSESIRTGREAAPSEPSLAHNWRYWSLTSSDRQLVYDQWQDTSALYRIEPDASNYPLPLPVSELHRQAQLGRELQQQRQRLWREYLELPPDHSRLARAVIGVPTLLLAEEGSAVPSFERDGSDGRWQQEVAMRLECGPDEKPGPLALATPWAPGEYRVWARFSDSYRRSGYQNRFRIEFLGGGNAPVEVDGRKAPSSKRYDLGVQQIGELLKLRISQPVGGVAIAGFELELQGVETLARPEPDEALQERLRALGYVR